MNKKRSSIIFIAVGLLLIIASIIILILPSSSDKNNSSDGNEEKKKVPSTPLLYEVSKEGSENKIYLFGSIHVADDRAYPLPNAVMNAYKSSDYLAVEFDLIAYEEDLEAQMNSLKILLCDEGQTVKDLLKSDTYDKMVSYLKENKVYNSIYDSYKPVLFYSLITNIQAEKSELDSTKGIDMYFLNQAKEDKKEILEVESSDYQYKMLSSFPNELFDFLITYSIENDALSIASTKQLYETWLKGNEQELATLLGNGSNEDYSYDGYDNLEEIMKNYENVLVTQRNNEMTDKAEGYFNEGKNVFFVVGAAHIVGDDALVDLLTERGYSVKKVNY